jgi:hypothetical protein
VRALCAINCPPMVPIQSLGDSDRGLHLFFLIEFADKATKALVTVLRLQAWGRVNVFCSGNVYSETIPTNVIAYWAISEGVTLQGVKDPRGKTGMHATRKRGPRPGQPPLGGLTK